MPKASFHIQLVTDEPKAFDSFMAHYGKFSGVTDYIALIGRKSDKLNEICGYYGEQLVLLAAQLGLWTAVGWQCHTRGKNALYDCKRGEAGAVLSHSATERRTEHHIKANHPRKLR
ncbi:MAG: nitroreductase family protein [[Eubacterium] siraeum]